MDLPLAAALNNTSIEYVSTEDENRPSADDFYLIPTNSGFLQYSYQLPE